MSLFRRPGAGLMGEGVGGAGANVVVTLSRLGVSAG